MEIDKNWNKQLARERYGISYDNINMRNIGGKPSKYHESPKSGHSRKGYKYAKIWTLEKRL